MSPSDKAAFAEILTTVFDAYGKPVSKPGATLWWNLMSQYDIDAFRRACNAHMLDAERGRFMPLPADIVRLIEGSGGDRAAVAFEKARTAIRSVGPYRSVVFDDPLIHACVEQLGGWTRICDWSSDEVPFRAKEFTDHYRALAARREVPKYTAILMGEHDLANRLQHAESVRGPVFIGDHGLALQVMQSGGERRVAITEGVALDVRKALKAVGA